VQVLQLSKSAYSACSVVRMSLNWIRARCSDARGLHVVLQHLAARRGRSARAWPRPDAPRDATITAYSDPCRWRRRTTVGREVIDHHAARQVVLDDREAVGEREGELADRVRAGLGDVVAGDRDRVEVAHVLWMKYACTSPIIRIANSVEKMQVFCAWSSLRMSPGRCRGPAPAPRHAAERSRRRRAARLDQRRTRGAEQPEPRAVVAGRQLAAVGRARAPRQAAPSKRSASAQRRCRAGGARRAGRSRCS